MYASLAMIAAGAVAVAIGVFTTIIPSPAASAAVGLALGPILLLAGIIRIAGGFMLNRQD